MFGSACVTVVGEALVDLVPAERDGLLQISPGGSPANVAVGLARLGVPVQLVARLAEDAFGRRVRAHLVENGVDLSLSVRAQEPTSLAIVSVGTHGSPEYDFRVDGTADWQWADAELAGVPGPASVALHAGSLAAVLEPGAAAIARLVSRARSRATVSYDPNCRPLLMGPVDAARRRIEALVALADVVKVSAEDLNWLEPGRAPSDVAAAWLELGPAIVAVTLGGDGVLATGAACGTVFVAGQPVEVVDTVGAGDAFQSALLAALYTRQLLGEDRREALRAISAEALSASLGEAVLAAALTCGQRGANPPTRALLQQAQAQAHAQAPA